MTPQEREYQDLFHQAIKRIGKAWEAGGVESELERGAGVPGDHFNDVWVACLQGLASMDEFRAALSAWEIANYKKINELKEKSNGANTLHQAGLFH